MDTLKGKQIMVWTFMGNARMYEALRDYGDRISQIGLFSFKVRATGEIYESGVSIADGSTMRTYISKWPHIKWLLTVANDGTNSIFKALRDNTDGAQDKFLSEIVRIMEKYPWCDGIDIDLEKDADLALLASTRECTKNGRQEQHEGFYQYSAAWDSKHKVTLEEGKSARVLFEMQEMSDGEN